MGETSLKEYLQQTYDLTPIEIRICVLVAADYDRTDTQTLLQLRPETLKFHLKNIYAKTLPQKGISRDKLHRLSILLRRICKDLEKSHA